MASRTSNQAWSKDLDADTHFNVAFFLRSYDRAS